MQLLIFLGFITEASTRSTPLNQSKESTPVREPDPTTSTQPINIQDSLSNQPISIENTLTKHPISIVNSSPIDKIRHFESLIGEAELSLQDSSLVTCCYVNTSFSSNYASLPRQKSKGNYPACKAKISCKESLIFKPYNILLNTHLKWLHASLKQIYRYFYFQYDSARPDLPGCQFCDQHLCGEFYRQFSLSIYTFFPANKVRIGRETLCIKKFQVGSSLETESHTLLY